ncbi:hypothetical protein B0T17DRAFT_556897 [Bombardia bombarda]|uniref:Methyltransferase n=1 Tax=Bombardia bombarda TaxID=252184 RepID=A0AA39XAE1_9PEZI|nr:hypothetical protein B0T17DRAFT_556897 [Bombardia bombarda]
MTTGVFRYTDPTTISRSTESFIKTWSKVDVDYSSYKRLERKRSVTNLYAAAAANGTTFGTDVSGFAVYASPSTEKAFVSDSAVRTGYYPEVEALIRSKLGPKVKKVVIFDHTIRRNDASAPRQPVRQVHVDQTPGAAATRVRRHLPPDEAESLLKGRYQIINVWRPIGHAATDFPLAVIDWRTTSPEDLVAVDLLYPKRQANGDDDDDDRGKEVLPDAASLASTDGYEVKGETYGILPNGRHKFYYAKDMTPDEAMFIKCFDSRSEGQPGGKQGVAALTPHTAFVDPQTPAGTKPRESIEVRCLVFYD